MIDFSKIVEDLRLAIASASPDWADFLRSAVADYAVACDEVNERLRKCQEYLRRGLRSEAIQLAEIEPNLLECVAMLDLSERDYCNQVLPQYGIRPLPNLMIDVAAQLNEAYATDQPLQELIRQHRLLALRHAPLDRRLSVLRQLAEGDPNNLVWQEDLEAFETERMKQIRGELDQAVAKRDFAKVSALTQELMDPSWHNPPDVKLVHHARNSAEILYRQVGREELEQLVHELNEAYSTFDLARAQRLRDRWQTVATGIGLPDVDQLYLAAVPTLEWIAAEEQQQQQEADFHQTISSLEYALDRKDSFENINRIYHKALSYDRELPEFLTQRFERYVEQYEVDRTRRFRVRMVAVAIGTIFLAGLVGAGIYFPMKARWIAGHANQLAILINNDQLDEAEAYLKKLCDQHPEVASDPSIEKNNTEIKKRLQQERDRQAGFDTLEQRVRKMLEEKQADEKALQELERTAKSPAERNRATLVRSDLQRLLREQQAAHDTAFDDKLKEVAAKIEEFNPQHGEDLDQLLAQLRQLQQELTGLEEESDRVSAAFASQLKPLKGRTTVAEQALNKRQEERKALDRIDRSLGDFIAFEVALGKYANDFPETRRAQDFKQVVGESPHWKKLEKWNEFAKLWQGKSISQLSVAEARELLEKTQAYQKESPLLADGHQIAAKLPYLQAICQREGSSGKIIARLERLFADPLMENLWMVKHVNGKRYYGNAEPRLHPTTTYGYSYINSFSFTEKKVSLTEGDVVEKGPAPQAKLAHQLQALLGALSDQTWDKTFYQMIKAIVEDDEIEPLLKIALLRATYDVGGQGSLVFSETFGEFGAALRGRDIKTSANWLDPDDSEGNTERANARELLANLPSISTLAKNAQRELAKLKEPVGTPFVWVGWIRRNGDGTWNCVLHRSVASGNLYVMNPQSKPELMLIGKASGLRAELAMQNQDRWLEGRPVFASNILNNK